MYAGVIQIKFEGHGALDQHSVWFPNSKQQQLFRKNAMQYGLQPVIEDMCLRQCNRLGS